MTFVRLLYGSRARGEADALSDTDILTVGDQLEGADYSWSDIDRLRSYGSLFLWHLHLEARVLEGDGAGRERWEHVTTGLPPYGRVDDDLDAFQTVLDDVARSLADSDADLQFEGAVLARTIRHAAILACFLASEPNFSRYGAVTQATENFGIRTPHGARFENLYDLLLRPSAASNLEAAALSEWLEVGVRLVSSMRSMGGERDGD